MAVPTESLDDRRFALLLAVSQYADATLSRLRSPAADAVALRDLLADPEVGGFAVTSVFDEKAQAMRLAVEEFLTDRRPDDLVLVYLSCHGLVDARRRLYFAARDTIKNRLASSGVEAHWLLEQLEDCRARRQVVVLDCCFSGAFAQRAKGDTDVALGERLVGEGRGRVVLTASRGTEYSFEGEPTEGQPPAGSVFTTALVSGITSGEADADNDGHISVDEAYAYAFEKVREAGAQQTPQRWLYGAEGSIVLARTPVDIGETTRTEPVPRRASPEARIEPAPATVPPAGPETRLVPPRWRPWLLGAAAAALIVLAGALGVRLLDGDAGGGPEDGGVSGPHQLTVEAPWRLVVRGQDVADEGCRVTVTDEAGQSQTVEGVYATEYFQMHSSGTVEWEANHADCEVLQQPTANEQRLPFVWRISQGDTPAFSAGDAVTVDVLNFHGTDGCELELHAIEDGRAISFATVPTDGEPTVLETYGASPTYVADTTCSFRITAGR
ncbi:caspase domain-containing protein [Nocardioides sp. GCM10028917]|uniref:caspase family protein n=1 Tax=Nocardioides sp. GCM10028917 TaxID=3273408 RepID=UPI00360E8E2A